MKYTKITWCISAFISISLLISSYNSKVSTQLLILSAGISLGSFSVLVGSNLDYINRNNKQKNDYSK